jgi:N-acetylglucosaminyl-diphospho-decaprenol L-rhamnosyltransferase
MQPQSMNQALDLSIVIINWNSVGLLRQCLRTVYANISGVASEIIVIDNASYDGCAEMVVAEFPSVRFFQSERNLGFAAANNVCAERATGRNLLFLNPDTEILGSALQAMLACIDAKKDAGAVGPKLLNSDGSLQVTCLQPYPSVMNQLVGAARLQAMFPKWSVWGNGVLFEEDSRPRPVEGVVGACMMVDAGAFREVGGFHTGYFMYAEDMDLCYKLEKTGRTNYYVGTASVVHHGGSSSGRQADPHFSTIVMRDSIQSFMRIHRGPVYATFFRSLTALAALIRMGLLTVPLLLPVDAERRRQLRHSFGKWLRVFRWAIGNQTLVRRAA